MFERVPRPGSGTRKGKGSVMVTEAQKDHLWAVEILTDPAKFGLVPGDTIYTVVRHVTSSGMTRWIDAYVIRDGEPRYITRFVAKATGRKVNTRNHDGVECGGCGMDMGFDLVYNLSRALFPDGFDCIGEPCPSNDHSNGDRDYSPHRHRGGGYALRHRWL